MPPENTTRWVGTWIFATVLALAAALAFVALIAIMRLYYIAPTESEEPTSPQKQEILDQLGAEPNTPIDERQSVVDQLSESEQEVSVQEKLRILQNLDAR